jgi:hypothetical protein
MTTCHVRSFWAIRVPRPKIHGDYGYCRRDCVAEPDLQVGEAEALDDLWRPDAKRVEASRSSKVDEGQREHADVGETAPDAVVCRPRLLGAFRLHGVDKPRSLVIGKPRSLLRLVSHVEQHDDTKDDCRYRLHDKQPLPALEPADTVHFKERTRERRSEHDRNWYCRHEQRGNRRTPMRREPVAEVQDDAGKEARLGGAKQESEHIKARRIPDEGHRRGDNAPRDHHSRDPKPRPDLVQDDVGGDLEEEVAPKENPGAKTKDHRRESEILVHRQRSKPNIDTINIRNKIK